MTYDYGADDAWVALASHCSEAREPQYSYRLCLFDKAAQVDNGGGHETSLGAWKGFEKGYTEVRFSEQPFTCPAGWLLTWLPLACLRRPWRRH